jgi:glucan-binding YG repeat protein
MRKQTKLVAVLSASALLAIGASMTSFAASPWVEENGTWVYYEKNGEKATEVWRKSGDKWYWLNEDGEMAENQLIEYDNNYYYVDQGGAMVIGEWRSVENEDYEGEDDDEPLVWWYYFGPNGKAYKASNVNTNASFKTINGHKYIFDEEGKMLYGWIDESGVRQTGDAAWQTGVYYCGTYDDGRQRNNEWAYLDIIDTGYTSADYNKSTEYTFDDEVQTRWFWFLANGKKVHDKDNYTVPLDKKKYSFDEYGRMNAEWATRIKNAETPDTAKQSDNKAAYASYTSEFRYYGDPETGGAKVTKGFFKAVPDYYLNSGAYDDSEEKTFYADRNGNLVAGKFETISGKKYAFDEKGIMQTGLKAIQLGADKKTIASVLGSENRYDTYENFKDWYNTVNCNMYYFSSDGAMLTGKQTVKLDGESYTFLFNKAGSEKGAGKNGLDNKKYYMGGMLLAADRSDKYAVVKIDASTTPAKYSIMTIEDFLENEGKVANTNNPDDKKFEEYNEINAPDDKDGVSYRLVNTSGTMQVSKTKAKDGNGLCVNVNSNGEITAIYVES